MNADPLVTVIVPTRNSAGTLGRLLGSIRAQTFSGIELIVVDNQSSDQTWAIANSFADRVLSCGPERSAQRNRGAEAARGRFLLMVDSDMVLGMDVVERCVDVAERTGAKAVVIPEVSEGSGYWSACRALERSCYPGDATIEAPRFFDKDVYLRLGGYDEGQSGSEDWDLAARVAATQRVARADGCRIVHDEGVIRLGPHLRKKYYYGKSFGTYIRRHPTLARAQLTPLRPALLRNWRHLAARPGLGVGVVVLKIAEFAAGGLGLASSAMRRS